MRPEIRVYHPLEPEFDRLILLCYQLEEKTGIPVRVESLWFDIGAHLAWTTLVSTDSHGMDYQLLDPALQDLLLHGTEDEREKALEETAARLKRLAN